VKDLAQDVAEDVLVLDAAKDGSAKVLIVKMLILSIVISLLPAAEPTPNTRVPPPSPALR